MTDFLWCFARTMQEVVMDTMNQTIILSDNRELGYCQFGDVDSGTPIFFFTGGQSSRLDGRQFDGLCKELSIHLITVDRPGIGLSTLSPLRTFLDWPDDVEELANYLSLKKFSVFGLSGGGPHTLATVYKIPNRVRKAAVVSGTAPMSMPNRSKGMWFPIRVMFFLARYLPWFHRKALDSQAKMILNQEKYLKQMQMGLPTPDMKLLTEFPEVGTQYLEAGIEGYRNGTEGDFCEWQLYVKNWGFELHDVSKEVALWYGEFDGMAPPHMGRYLAKELPNSILNIVPDGGHFSTIHNYIRDILGYLKF